MLKFQAIKYLVMSIFFPKTIARAIFFEILHHSGFHSSFIFNDIGKFSWPFSYPVPDQRHHAAFPRMWLYAAAHRQAHYPISRLSESAINHCLWRPTTAVNTSSLATGKRWKPLRLTAPQQSPKSCRVLRGSLSITSRAAPAILQHR